MAPFDQIPNMKPTSWLDDALPECLWSVLLVGALDRDDALSTFRLVGRAIDQGQIVLTDGVLTHSALSRDPASALAPLARLLVEDERVAGALYPLINLPDLPGYEIWAEHLEGAGNPEEVWPRLADAVMRSFDHQSQEATDCRWMKVLAMLLSGKLNLGSRDAVLEILEYPDRGDMRKVRPTIRATEIGFRHAEKPTEWAVQFWRQCFDETQCGPLFSYGSTPSPESVGVTVDQVRKLETQVISAYMETLANTVVDARRDAVFGMAAYSVRLLNELMRPDASASVTARMTLRTLAEITITLSYLALKDDLEKWAQYRNYGVGQAKLVFMKQEGVEEPSFVTTDVLEAMASEDRWLEFTSIELGNWDKKNLRKLAESSKTKDVYDLYYDWTSHHSHGHWGAVRESCFLLCANPLHRFHRVLAAEPIPLGDVLPDAARVIDRTMDTVRRAYPEAVIDRLVPAEEERPQPTEGEADGVGEQEASGAQAD